MTCLGRSESAESTESSTKRPLQQMDETVVEPKPCKLPRLDDPADVRCKSCVSPEATEPILRKEVQNVILAKGAEVDRHVSALRLEFFQLPLRTLLSRLMSHPLNRHNLFNLPVDAVALGLKDYHLVIVQPMDLGTIKKKLYCMAYASPLQFASDVRLTFNNAMQYNPPNHLVHEAAKQLLSVFEEGLSALVSSAARKYQTLSYSNTISSSSVSSVTHVSQPLHLGLTSTAPVSRLPLSSKLMVSSLPGLVGASRNLKRHRCRACMGDICGLCGEGCLSLEPVLLVCQGKSCLQKIRKGSTFYCSTDGDKLWCHKCYMNLSPVLPLSAEDSDEVEETTPPVIADAARSSSTTSGGKLYFKKDLLRRKCDEEVMESWVKCSKCAKRVHEICAFHNPHLVSSEEFVCPMCEHSSSVSAADDFPQHIPDTASMGCISAHVDGTSLASCSKQISAHDQLECTYVSGNTAAVRNFSTVTISAAKLPSCPMGSFIEMKVRERMVACGYGGGPEKTITIRVIAETNKSFQVPSVVQRHFELVSKNNKRSPVPSSVNYTSKNIALFQRIDGVDVCILCMYVQEYDDPNPPEEEVMPDNEAVLPCSVDLGYTSSGKRVYIAYLDSVDHFRPRECRTSVYQEILVSYLAYMRMKGFSYAHIWACPPTRGNSFVFWSHPSNQKTPTRDRLEKWYHGALARAVQTGTVTNVESLYDAVFAKNHSLNGRELAICPPLFDGDFWIEESVRAHRASLSKQCSGGVGRRKHDRRTSNSSCPAIQVGEMIQLRVMNNNCSIPFRKPVNSAALGLKDYALIITRPMDLGTVHGKCVLGEYDSLKDLIADVDLVVSNARTYNPVGHPVHNMAIEMRTLFYSELKQLVSNWSASTSCVSDDECEDNLIVDVAPFYETSMRLSAVVKTNEDDDESIESNDIVVSKTQASPSNNSLVSAKVSSNNLGILSSPKHPTRPKPHKNPVGRPKSTKTQPMKLDLLTGGAGAIAQRMLGNDFWLLEKNPRKMAKHLKAISSSAISSRRESWLGEEIGVPIRKMKRDFFVCSLQPKTASQRSQAENQKIHEFAIYSQGFRPCIAKKETRRTQATVLVDARGALLEHSQLRHYQFDSLRRAKYSTSMILYHLHNPDAPGLDAICTQCSKCINEVRWHCTKTGTKKDICVSCFSSVNGKDQENYIPVPVTLGNRQ